MTSRKSFFRNVLITYDFAPIPVHPGSTLTCSLEVQLPGRPKLISRDWSWAHPLLPSFILVPSSRSNYRGFLVAPDFHWFTGFVSLYKVKPFPPDGKDIKKYI